MSNPESTSPLESSKKENLVPTQAKIAELNESRTELMSRIQSLKQDLQNWRSKLDTQVQSYRTDLVELRKSLNVEVDQLRSEFQELKTTLQQQQEDMNASLKNLGLQDPLKDAGMDPTVTVDEVTEGDNAEADESGSSSDKTNGEEPTEKENGTKVYSSATEVAGADINN